MKTNGYIYIDSYLLPEYCDKASFVLYIYIYGVREFVGCPVSSCRVFKATIFVIVALEILKGGSG